MTRIIEGDCLEALRELDAESVDAVATDPPYSLAFMGKAWDSHPSPAAFQAWCREWAAECLRVLKPGGRLLAFGGTRTIHRLISGVEDAGFEIRDMLTYLYGTGFPKSHNIGNGMGTALKPGWEGITLARKPLTGTVAANVEQHGTGALNIDGCRIAPSGQRPSFTPGRWPSNVVLDPEAAAMLDASVAPSTSRIGRPRGAASGDGWGMTATGAEYADTGGPSRYFYCAKASRREREAGVGGQGRNVHPPSGDDRCWDIPGSRSQPRHNVHPCVKPVALMRWLVRLVTPPGGLVLDPFAGSGSTGIACLLEGMEFVGIEREAEYVEIARERIAHAEAHPHDFDPDEPEPEPVPEGQLSIGGAA